MPTGPSIFTSGGVPASGFDINGFSDATRPSAWIAQAWSRLSGPQSNTSQLASQRMDMTAIYLPVGRTITNVIYCSADTACNTPQNWWFALYDNARNLLRQTADQTTTAWGANTLMSVALSSTYVTTYSGLYYTAIMVKAGVAVPTLVGSGYRSSAIDNVAPFATQIDNVNTSLTTTAPNPHAAPTANSNAAWSAVS